VLAGRGSSDKLLLSDQMPVRQAVLRMILP
jgi:hypothetical protein